MRKTVAIFLLTIFSCTKSTFIQGDIKLMEIKDEWSDKWVFIYKSSQTNKDTLKINVKWGLTDSTEYNTSFEIPPYTHYYEHNTLIPPSPRINFIHYSKE